MREAEEAEAEEAEAEEAEARLLGPNRYQNFTHCLQSILINANIAAVI